MSFVGEPRATHRSVLKIDLEATDDYGVAEIALLLAPPGREAETERPKPVDADIIALLNDAWKASKRDERGYASLSEVGQRADSVR